MNTLYNDNLNIAHKKEKISITKRIIDNLTDVLDAIIEENTTDSKITIIDKNYIILDIEDPSISISEYIERLVINNDYSLSSLICCFILIDRLINNKKFIITKTNIYKVVFSCYILSIKFNNDFIYSDRDFSFLGGFSINTFNRINNLILDLLNYNIYISEEDFNEYFKFLFI